MVYEISMNHIGEKKKTYIYISHLIIYTPDSNKIVTHKTPSFRFTLLKFLGNSPGNFRVFKALAVAPEREKSHLCCAVLLTPPRIRNPKFG